MASITKHANGRRTIQFVGGDSRRRSIRLGRVTQKAAEGIKYRIEVLNACRISSQPIDNDTAKWVRSIDDFLAEKLANAGLIESRKKACLGDYLKQYIASRTDVKERTEKKYRSTEKRLIEFFGESKPIRDITLGDADEFRRKLLRDNLAENTIRKHISIAKTFFHAAVRHNLIDVNPFQDQKSNVQPNDERFHFVSVETSQKVIDACPDHEWRLLFALSRWGGLRCPSESLELKWSDINFAKGIMTVRSPKTEHHAGHDKRLVPIFPELRPYLEDSREMAAKDAEYVIARYRSTDTNLRQPFAAIIAKAGVTRWQKPFQNLRSTRQTELAEMFPSHVVCAWIGNSQRVAARHYLQVTDEHYQKALQKPVQSAPELHRIEVHGVRETPENHGIACHEVAVRGLEPPLPEGT